MNQFLFRLSALCIGLVPCLCNFSHGQIYTNTTIVAGPSPCEHVIRMMMRHGVNNHFDRTSAASLLSATPFGCAGLPTEEIGDLRIVQANLMPPLETGGGPRIAVVVMNQSRREIRSFHLSAVAILGRIHAGSPTDTVRIDRILPGEALEVVVRLPIEALSIGHRNGEVLGYDKLIVAVDCFDVILEADEANNLRLFEASELTMVTSAVSVTAVSVLQETETTATQLVSAVPSNAVPSSRANSGDVSVDALDLEHPTPDSLRSAIQSVGRSTPQTGSAPTVAPQ